MAHVLGSKKYEDRLNVILGHENAKYRPLYCSKAQGWVDASTLWKALRKAPDNSCLVVVFQTHDSSKTVGGSMVKPTQLDTWFKVRTSATAAS